ncbi:MAG TPA: signal peptidase II [Myxococcota bacterium]|nr:signal peptidase II [Myxococcota bacterium]
MKRDPQTPGRDKVGYPVYHAVIVLAVGLTAGLLDQISKWIAVSLLAPGRPLQLVPGFFELQLRANPHGAFGLFANLPDDLRLPVLLALGMLAILAIVTFAVRTLGWSRTTSISLGLILGGAISNLADRLARGEVMDFIDVSWAGRAHWPTFNLADMSITAGSLILVGYLYRSWRRRPREEEA